MLLPEPGYMSWTSGRSSCPFPLPSYCSYRSYPSSLNATLSQRFKFLVLPTKRTAKIQTPQKNHAGSEMPELFEWFSWLEWRLLKWIALKYHSGSCIVQERQEWLRYGITCPSPNFRHSDQMEWQYEKNRASSTYGVFLTRNFNMSEMLPVKLSSGCVHPTVGG